MRKIILLAALISLNVCIGYAQEKQADTAKTGALPYQKFPTLPAFNILLMDSVTIFNTYNIPEGNPIALFFFDPECSHCQAVIKSLLKDMDSIKDIRFYMITPVHSATELRDFYTKYRLADYKNIVLAGRDYEFFFGSYYGVKYVPDIALYDAHKKLIKLFEGSTSAKELHKYTH